MLLVLSTHCIKSRTILIYMKITHEKSILVNHLYSYKIRNWIILILNLEAFEDMKSSYWCKFHWVSFCVPEEECTVVTAFTSESVPEPQLASIRAPWMITGAMVVWRRAAFSGAMWLYWTEDRHPTKPRLFALATSESNPTFSATWKTRAFLFQTYLLLKKIFIVYILYLILLCFSFRCTA